MLPVTVTAVALLCIFGLASSLPGNLENAAAKAVYLGEFGNKEYYTSETPYARTAAKAYCENNGMALLSVNSEPESDYLRDLLLGLPRSSYWTAALQKYVDMRHYYWEGTDVTFTFNHGWYGFGYASFPIACLVIDSDQFSQISFRVDQCDHTYHALCQKIV